MEVSRSCFIEKSTDYVQPKKILAARSGPEFESTGGEMEV